MEYHYSPMLAILMEFSTHEVVRDGVMTADECRQVDVEQRLSLNAHPSIDHAQIYLRWVAKDERGQRIMGSPSCKFQCIEPIADKICRHSRREIANVIATKDGCTSSCCQPQNFSSGHCCRIARHPVQEQGLPCFCKQMRTIVGC